MANVFDIAAYILAKKGPITAMKLQKLVYYAQAWSLVWDEKPLFKNKIEAWANGPVAPALYQEHKGQFQLHHLSSGDARKLAPTEKGTVNAVLGFYGGKTSQWLSDLTHSERPWVEARKGLKDGQRGANEITHAAMAEFYGSL